MADDIEFHDSATNDEFILSQPEFSTTQSIASEATPKSKSRKRKSPDEYMLAPYFRKIDRVLDDVTIIYQTCTLKKHGGTDNCTAEYKGLNTYGPKEHLRTKHPDEYKIFQSSAAFKTLKKDANFDKTIADRLLARHVGSSTTSLRQGSSKSFANFCHYLNPSYNLPSRQTLTTKICEEAVRARELVKSLLADTTLFHLSTDLWTQKNNRHSYSAINVHLYLDSLGRQVTICLGIKKVSDHKSTSILKSVEEILHEYGKDLNDVGLITTDNAAANKKAFRDEYFESIEIDDQTNLCIDDEQVIPECDVEPATLSDNLTTENKLTSKWIPCADHTLQLALKVLDKDEKFLQIKKEVMSLLRSISNSFIATQALRSQTNLGLIFPAPTRWNSLCLCYERFQRCFDQIMTVAADRSIPARLSLNTNENRLYIQQIVTLLSHFLRATKTLEGDSIPTSAMAAPTILSLIFDIEEPEEEDAYSELGELPANLVKELKKRFAYAINPHDSKFSPVLAAASVLHPECCSVLSEDLRIAGCNEISKWIARLPKEETISTPISTVARFGRLATKNASSTASTQPNKTLIDKYLSTISETGPIDNIYDFWNSKNAVYKELSIVAKQLLPAPASSSSCERDFSFTTLFTECRKANTSPTVLDSKLILATNQELLNLLDPIISN